jgi:hypothetical protein
MHSATPGNPISAVEVLGTTPEAFRLRVGEQELAIAYADFPWFREATRAQIDDVALPFPGHLRWEQLDIDLAVESIIHPGKFPLVAATRR